MSQRFEFVVLASQVGTNFRQLCRRFGISPKTGYKWCARYATGGAAALVNQSRRPKRSPGSCGEAMAAKVVALRREHPTWGGRKLRRRLQDLAVARVPAASTCTPDCTPGSVAFSGSCAHALAALRADNAQRTLADGLQGTLPDPSRKPLSPADRARRSQSVQRGALAAGRSDRPDGEDNPRTCLWPIRSARTNPLRQRAALGLWRPDQPLHQSGRVAVAVGRTHYPRPAVSSTNPEQGRTIPPHAAGRTDQPAHVARSGALRRALPAFPRLLQLRTTPRCPARGDASLTLPAQSAQPAKHAALHRVCHQPDRAYCAQQRSAHVRRTNLVCRSSVWENCPSACARARRPTGSGKCSSPSIGWGNSTSMVQLNQSTQRVASISNLLLPTTPRPFNQCPCVTYVPEHLLPLSPAQTDLNALSIINPFAPDSAEPFSALGSTRSTSAANLPL